MIQQWCTKSCKLQVPMNIQCQTLFCIQEKEMMPQIVGLATVIMPPLNWMFNREQAHPAN